MLNTIGTGLNIYSFGSALNDSIDMYKDNATPEEFANKISEYSNPLGIFGILGTRDIDANYLHDDAPLEARMLADYISNKGPQRMTNFSRKVEKSLSNKYSNINENTIKDSKNNIFINYGT